MSVSLFDHFASLEDPRVDRTKLHALLDIVTLTICGVLCGADGWDDIHFYACALESWYRTFLPLTNGIPSSDTIRRVISAIHPDQFHRCFLSWVTAMTHHLPDSIVAIDGKTVCGAHDPSESRSFLHIVSAWSKEQHLVLAEEIVSEKSNEITAIPELLKLLAVKNCIVTIDAMGCQKKIVQDIVNKEAGYAIVLKENQKHLYHATVETFRCQDVRDMSAHSASYTTEEQNHGRYERRTSTVTDDLAGVPDLSDWAGLTHLGKVTCERQIHDVIQQETRYYILSHVDTAEKLAEASRGHWGIENSVHWSLDVTFHEDSIRIYDGYGAENLAVVRKIALNTITRDKTRKLSIKKKRALFAIDPNYRMQILACVTDEGK